MQSIFITMINSSSNTLEISKASGEKRDFLWSKAIETYDLVNLKLNRKTLQN